MKKILFACSVLILCSFVTTKNNLHRDEKTFLISQFENTKANLLSNIQGLSDEQMHYKTAPDRWSVSECLEHIILTEKGLFGMEQEFIKQPANPEKREDIKVTDEDLLKGISDRSQKAKAPEMFTPAGRFATTADAVNAFSLKRDSIIAYIKDTDDDLRNHVMTQTPGGAMDTYQFMLLISAHSARHTKQIEEVKADPGFPK